MEKDYQVIVVCGRKHVIGNVKTRSSSSIPDADYMGTGKALCGILEKGETLEQWIDRRTKRRKELRLND